MVSEKSKLEGSKLIGTLLKYRVYVLLYFYIDVVVLMAA